MTRGFTPRRVFVLGLLAVTVAGGIVIGVAGISHLNRESVEQSLGQLSSYQAMIATQPQIETELKRLQQETGSLTGLVSGESAPLAAANIEKEIRAMVTQAGGEIRSSQNLAPTPAEGFEKIEIAYDIVLPMNQLAQLIYRIETHAPYLFLDRVNLETPQNISPVSGNTVPRVDAHWVVRGYRWKG